MDGIFEFVFSERRFQKSAVGSWLLVRRYSDAKDMKRLCGCRTTPAYWDTGREDEDEDAAAGMADVAKRYTALRVVDTLVADEVAPRVFATSTPLPSRPVSTMRDGSAGDRVEPEAGMEKAAISEGGGGEPTEAQMEIETETHEQLPYLTRSISLPESPSGPSQVVSRETWGASVKVEVEVEAEDCASEGGAEKAGVPPKARAGKGSHQHTVTENCMAVETKLRACAFALAEVSAWCQRRPSFIRFVGGLSQPHPA